MNDAAVPKIDNLGLIAGNGQLPVATIAGARRSGIAKIFAACFNGETSETTAQAADGAEWFEVGQLNKLIKFFKANNVSQAVMVGQLNPRHTVSALLKLDLRMMAVLLTLPNRKADTVLGAIAAELNKDGIEVLDSTLFIRHLLATPGPMGKIKPNGALKDDIEFGRRVASEMGRVDVGQTVVVKNGAIVAVEAMEGSDAAIKRGCELGGEGMVVVKMSKPKQDLRFDVPVIGLKTMRTLVDGKAAALAVEAGRTIVLDKDELIAEADRNGVCVFGI